MAIPCNLVVPSRSTREIHASIAINIRGKDGFSIVRTGGDDSGCPLRTISLHIAVPSDLVVIQRSTREVHASIAINIRGKDGVSTVRTGGHDLLRRLNDRRAGLRARVDDEESE